MTRAVRNASRLNYYGGDPTLTQLRDMNRRITRVEKRERALGATIGRLALTISENKQTINHLLSITKHWDWLPGKQEED